MDLRLASFIRDRENGHYDVIMLQETHVAQIQSLIYAAHQWGYRTGNGLPPLSYEPGLEFSFAWWHRTLKASLQTPNFTSIKYGRLIW